MAAPRDPSDIAIEATQELIAEARGTTAGAANASSRAQIGGSGRHEGRGRGGGGSSPIGGSHQPFGPTVAASLGPGPPRVVQGSLGGPAYLSGAVARDEDPEVLNLILVPG
jgi:hypothetical protein